MDIFTLPKYDQEPKVNLFPLVENAYLWPTFLERRDRRCFVSRDVVFHESIYLFAPKGKAKSQENYQHGTILQIWMNSIPAIVCL